MPVFFTSLGYLLSIGAALATFFAVSMFIYYIFFEPIKEWIDQYLINYADWMVKELDTQFIFVTIARCRLYIIGSVISGFLIGYFISRSIIFTTFITVLFFFIPRWVVNKMHKRRIAKFETQLVDALRVASNGLRAGFSLLQALELVVKQSPPPMSQEIGLVLREHSIGIQIEEALINLNKRIPTDDVEIVVTSITTLRETGGNLTETFDTIVETILERRKVEDKINAMTSEGVYQGYVLCALPFMLGLIVHLMDPEYMKPLYTTFIGWIMIMIIIILDAMGYYAIKKIVSIDV